MLERLKKDNELRDIVLMTAAGFAFVSFMEGFDKSTGGKTVGEMALFMPLILNSSIGTILAIGEKMDLKNISKYASAGFVLGVAESGIGYYIGRGVGEIIKYFK